MRLLNRKTFELEFFPDRPYPKYAILSHTWGPTGSEVMFRDMEKGTAVGKPGYQKLLYTCRQAEADDLDYVWIDTCCIDKESSSELSESINSMFLWYKEAKVCYAFMADIETGENPHTSDRFAKSKWFTRGWTLQELIAPKTVTFYSQDWVLLGSQVELASVISRITKIDEGILTGMLNLENLSVARRMSWAADRRTTRREDIAYCLMGIFDVNMAMLYGEGGEKAFRRLQEEIMKDSDDETLFAWTNPNKDQPELQGLLANSPENFRNSGHYIPDFDRGSRVPSSITSKGLCMSLGLRLLENDIWIGALECPVPPAYEESLAIYLKLLDKESQQYARIKADRLCKLPQRGPVQTIYVRQNPKIPGFDDVYLHHAFQLRKSYANSEDVDALGELSDHDYYLVGTAAPPLSLKINPLPTSAPTWVPPDCQRIFHIPRGELQLAGALSFRRPDGTNVNVLLGSRPGMGVAVDIIPQDEIAEKVSREWGERSSVAAAQCNSDGEAHFRDLEMCFTPHRPGVWFDLGQDRFRIDVQARPHAGIRYYMVDVRIEVRPTLNAADLLNLGNLVPGLPNLAPERPVRKWKKAFKKLAT